MQREAAALPVPDSVHELADDILCALRENGIRVSDRKYLNYARFNPDLRESGAVWALILGLTVTTANCPF